MQKLTVFNFFIFVIECYVIMYNLCSIMLYDHILSFHNNINKLDKRVCKKAFYQTNDLYIKKN